MKLQMLRNGQKGSNEVDLVHLVSSQSLVILYDSRTTKSAKGLVDYLHFVWWSTRDTRLKLER